MVSSNYKLFSKIAAVTIFSFMVAGALFVFKTDNEKIVTKQKFENEKVLILKKLNKLQDSIGIVMNQNNDYKTELENQNLKIASLIAKINGTSVANNDISDIKKDYSSEMASLRNEVASLRSTNAALIQQNNNYRKDIAALKSGQKLSPSLSLQSKSEVSTNNAPAEIEKSNVKLKDESISKILVSNLKTTTFNIDKSGFMQQSDKSNKANIVKVNFEVSGNKNVNFMFKEYYIQIIDVNNNVIGLRKTKKFGKADLTYSASYPLTFKNETIETTTNIDLVDAEKGTYYIFDNDKIMSKATFVLK
jgi:hypothetical protein